MNNNNSSKLERVVIELHDYNYYHGPSDSEDADGRFIGREDEIDKFESVLTDTSRRSGSYLVTGYRGMGKTSFVNKVLEKIATPGKPFKSIVHSIGLLFISLILSFLYLFYLTSAEQTYSIDEIRQPHISNFIGWLTIGIIGISYITLLIRGFCLIHKIKNSQEPFFVFKSNSLNRLYNTMLQVITTSPILSKRYVRSNRLWLIIFVFMASLAFIGEQDKAANTQKILLFYLILFLFNSLFITLFFKFHQKLNKTESGKLKDNSVGKKKKEAKISWMSEFFRFINYSDQITVKLNLGHSDLKEIDILKLIARNIKTSYSSFRHSLSFNLIVRFILLVILLKLSFSIYNLGIIKDFNSSLRINSGLSTLCPSQYNVFIQDSINYSLKDIASRQKDKGRYSTMDYYINTKILEEEYLLNNIERDSIEDFIKYLSYADENLFKYLSLNKFDRVFLEKLGSNLVQKSKPYFTLRKELLSILSKDEKLAKLCINVFVIKKEEILNWLKYEPFKKKIISIINNKPEDSISFNCMTIEKIQFLLKSLSQTIENDPVTSFKLTQIDSLLLKICDTNLALKSNPAIELTKIFIQHIDTFPVSIKEQFLHCFKDRNIKAQVKSIINNIPEKTIKNWSQDASFKDMEVKDMHLLLSYWDQIPEAFVKIEEENIDLGLLTHLKKIDELRNNYNEISSIKRRIIGVTNYLDYILSGTYYYGIKVFFFLKFFFPARIDYLYFIFLFTFLFVARKLVTLLNIQSISKRKIIRKINLLNEMVDSNLSVENLSSIGIPRASTIFSRRTSKTYPKDDVREIERYLIEIIEDIGKLPVYSYRAQFIFVFDELDKIDPRNETRETSSKEAIIGGTDAIQKRHKAVMELLSNLKYFLSTAQAKFIFIAGRELYDAFLADISDRNFRIGSIFHDVFYINSFLSDLHPSEFNDITSRTEQFVCQFLFPKNYIVTHKNLKNYNAYLKKKFSIFDEDHKEHKTSEKRREARQKREKVIHLLQQFIIYLNHVSKGAPSKLTSYFENYIKTPKSTFKYTEYGLLAGDMNKSELFLFFDYYTQYKISIVNYLFTPINFSINKDIRNYSDKLIVSASFLHDHLFKFHRSAFTWRDLESTPEMVDINKNPELREFLGSVIHFLLDTHIRPIINGLYDFKFPKRIAQEITFLSHISQEASATFNFTLDESRATKQHFYEQYIKLKENYAQSNTKKIEYIYSLSSAALTLADICFFDEDLGQANLYYLESIQAIRDVPLDKISLTQLVLLTRNMLKSGHVLEKRKTFDVAYLTYYEISLKVIQCLKFNFSYSKNNLNQLLDNIRFFYQPMLARFYTTEKTSFRGISSTDIKDINDEFKRLINYAPAKNDHIKAEFYNKLGDILFYKNKSFKDIEHKCPLGKLPNFNTNCSCNACSYYQKAIFEILNKSDTVVNDSIFIKLAKTIEKIKGNGHSYVLSNVELTLIAMMVSDFGDTLLTCIGKIEKLDFVSNSSIDLDKFIKQFESQNQNNLNPLESIMILFRISAYLYRKAGDHKGFSFQYTKFLYIIKQALIINTIDENKKGDLTELVKLISKEAIDGMYTAYEHIHAYEINRFKNIFNDNEVSYSPDISMHRISLNTEINEVLVLTTEIKILAGIDDNLSNTVNTLVNPYNLVSSMYNRYLRMRLKILYNQKQFEDLLNTADLFKSYSSCDLIAGLYSNIFLGTINIANINIDPTCINAPRIKAPQIDNTFINTTRINTIYLKKLEFLITDSIFCSFEILKILNTFGYSYFINHSMMAEAHEKLFMWSRFFTVYQLLIDFSKTGKIAPKNIEVYFKKIQNKEDMVLLIKDSKIIDNLGKLIEPDNLPFIMPIYQCNKAISEFYAAYESHTQGKAYKNLIEDMHYLNDDFNDRLYHFSIAMERLKIMNEKIMEDNGKIKKLKEQIQNSAIKNIDDYLQTIL